MNEIISKNHISNNEVISSTEKLDNIRQDIIIDSKKLENDSFFQKNFGNRETLFYIVLPSFKKLLKDEVDKKLISLYLTHMKKFINLLKKVSSNNNGNNPNNNITNEKSARDDNFYELISNVSAYMLYHFFPANRVLMRFGDEGEKFYILLNGTVTIIVTRKKSVNISLNEYFRYIALLIIYKEQQILKQVVKENKNSNFIEIPGIDFFFVISNESNPLILMRDIYLGINNKSIQNNKNFNNSKISNKSSSTSDKPKKKSEKKRRKSSYNEQKTINLKDLETEFLKVEEFLNIYLTNDELAFFYKSLNDEKYDVFEIDDNVNVSPENYVKRILNYSYDINILKGKKIKNLKEIIGELKKNDKKINKLNIYEYNILVELNSGDMFGEAALSAPSLKRNATIMTVTDCHFGCLNRKIYQKHIQKATETNKKNTINYICNTGIFNGYPKDILNKKFFSCFVFKKNKKNDYIIKQKEFNSNIILIKEGVFEIILNGSMIDIYNLINVYYKKLLNLVDNKITDIDEELHIKISKIKEQKQKIEKILGVEMCKNEEYKILLIDSPSTFGLREVEEKIKQEDKAGNISYQYISYYDVKCNSLKGEYIIIDKNIFYRQIYGTEYIVQESTKLISRQIIEKIIIRLLNIRLCKIYNLILSKGAIIKDNYLLQENKNILEAFHNNMNNDFYKRINILIDNCDENKFCSNNFEEYIYNYFENKKEKNLKEKREFKNRKERLKQNNIRKTLFKDHNYSYANTNTNNNNHKTFSITRISSAINSRSKLSFNLNKDKFSLPKNEKFLKIPSIKNKRNRKQNFDMNYYNSKSKLNNSPKNIKKKFRIKAQKLIKNKEEFNYDSILTHKFKNKKSDNIFQDSLLYIEKKDFFRDKFKQNDNEDYKNNTNIYNIKPKLKIIGGKNYISIPKFLFNKSKSVYELKSENQKNFLKNRSNYIINITRSFFTKKKDFNRKIRLKSS